MKKIFTLIAAAMMAASVNAQTTQNLTFGGNAWNVNFPMKENVKLTAKGNYAEYKLCTALPITAADYSGYRIEYSDIAGTADEYGTIMQLVLSSNETHLGKDWSGADAQVPNKIKYVSLPADQTSFTGTFDDFVATEDASTTCPTVGAINLQAVKKDNSILLKKFFLIKKDGTEVQATFAGDAWGGGAYIIEFVGEGFPSMEFLGQYGGQQLLLEDGSAATWSPSAPADEAVQTYTIKFKNTVNCALTVELQNAGTGFNWFNFEPGQKEITFVLDQTTCVKGEDPTPLEVGAVWLKAASAEASAYPADVTVEAAYRVLSSASSVDAITAQTVKGGAMYNLAGQRVNESYKGVVIQNGKKFINK